MIELCSNGEATPADIPARLPIAVPNHALHESFGEHKPVMVFDSRDGGATYRCRDDARR